MNSYKNKQDEREIKEKERFESLRRFFGHDRPGWLNEMIGKQLKENKRDIDDAPHRILGYYNEMKELEKKYGEKAEEIKSKISYNKKQEKIINKTLQHLLNDLDVLEKYQDVDYKIAKEVRPKQSVFGNSDLNEEIFSYLPSPSPLYENETERKERERFESLHRFFGDYKPDWLNEMIGNQLKENKRDIDDEQHRILGYYNEMKELEKKYGEKAEEIKSKINDEKRQIDLLGSIGKYLDIKQNQTKQKGGKSKRTNKSMKRKSMKRKSIKKNRK